MSKREVHFKEIENEIFSPGNLFWKKKSGVEVLISAKGDFLNHQLLKKISESDQKFLISNSVEQNKISEFKNLFQEYEFLIQIKEKNKQRKKILNFLNEIFYSPIEEVRQFELVLMCFHIFNERSLEENMAFFNSDIEFAMRSFQVASSYTLLAFLLGYYDFKFLKKLFNTTIENFSILSKDKLIMTFKEKLEVVKNKEKLEECDFNFIKNENNLNDEFQKILFERFDGSGVFSINKNEMNDLEIVFLSLNKLYSYKVMKDINNILSLVKKDSFDCDVKILNIIKSNFDEFVEVKVVA